MDFYEFKGSLLAGVVCGVVGAVAEHSVRFGIEVSIGVFLVCVAYLIFDSITHR